MISTISAGGDSNQSSYSHSPTSKGGRNYFIRWRFVLEDRRNTDIRKREALFRYYIPKWSDFMKEINEKYRLSRDQQRELPLLRRCVPSNIKLSDLINLLDQKNPTLARLLIEAAPIFEVAPHDLKCHIISAFNINADEYLAYETALNTGNH